jgi:hypothetical protein
MGRTPKIGGKEAQYVFQIQISSAYESNGLEAARDMAGTLFAWLPDEEGKVQATATIGNSD